MNEDKPDPVVNLPPMKFIGIPTNQGRTGNIQGACYSVISVSVITTVGVPVEGDLSHIVMKSINVVIHLEFGGKAYWVMSSVELLQTQSLYQWVDFLTNPPSIE